MHAINFEARKAFNHLLRISNGQLHLPESQVFALLPVSTQPCSKYLFQLQKTEAFVHKNIYFQKYLVGWKSGGGM